MAGRQRARQRRAHLLLHGSPDPLETRAHPRRPIPEDPPLPHIPWVRLEVQGSESAPTGEAPVEWLPSILVGIQRRPRPGLLGTARSPLGASIALGRGCRAVRSHAQILSKNRQRSTYNTLKRNASIHSTMGRNDKEEVLRNFGFRCRNVRCNRRGGSALDLELRAIRDWSGRSGGEVKRSSRFRRTEEACSF